MDGVGGAGASIVSIHEEKSASDEVASQHAVSTPEVLLQVLEEPPSAIAGSLFSRIFFGLRFGRAMEGVAISISGLALAFFIYLAVTSSLGIVPSTRNIVYIVNWALIVGAARWAYDEHQILDYEEGQRVVDQMRGQVARLTEQNSRLTLSITKFEGQVADLTQNVTNLGEENKKLALIRENLSATVTRLGEGQDVQAALLRLEKDLLEKREANQNQLEAITKAQADLQAREEALLARQEKETDKQQKLTNEQQKLTKTLTMALEARPKPDDG